MFAVERCLCVILDYPKRHRGGMADTVERCLCVILDYLTRHRGGMAGTGGYAPIRRASPLATGLILAVSILLQAGC